jgi:DNA polymerase-1
VHDVIAIETTTDRLMGDITAMRGIMAEASRIVLDEFELRTKAEIVSYPDRYADARGVEM